MESREFSLEVGGKNITATFSNLADQANGSVMVKSGETTILATAVMAKEPKGGQEFFPLVVDYEERFYAAGKILGGQFMRREGKPSEEAILTSRVIDRTIRPLFDQSIRNEIQVVVTTLSIDEENDPDILSIIGASLALGVSDIPWNGPVGALRIIMDADKKTKINPTYKDREEAILSAVVCGKEGDINMIEMEAREVSESEMASVLDLATETIQKIEEFQKNIVKEIGKKKIELNTPKPNREMINLFEEKIEPTLDNYIFSNRTGYNEIDNRQSDWLQIFKEKFPEAEGSLANAVYENFVNEQVHSVAIEKGERPDGRKPDEIRHISVAAGGISKILHGSGTFYRGETHVLSVLTLGGPKDSLLLEGMEIRKRKYFMHHYNFPPFSSGETGRIGGVNRRAIGHGALAEKALRAILPDRETFPYTIRIVSESLASNGSTSMASVCASSVALMDGGVPIKRPAAGISMGLMSRPNGQYKILTDIQGPEDHYGDMDFKVAGTRNGITAIQLDVKVSGIPKKILNEALSGAKTARLQILEKIENAIPGPRPNLNPAAPKIIKIKIDTDKIGLLIGPGGETIKQLTEETGAEIEIEQNGIVCIVGKNEESKKAEKKIGEILSRANHFR